MCLVSFLIIEEKEKKIHWKRRVYYLFTGREGLLSLSLDGALKFVAITSETVYITRSEKRKEKKSLPKKKKKELFGRIFSH